MINAFIRAQETIIRSPVGDIIDLDMVRRNLNLILKRVPPEYPPNVDLLELMVVNFPRIGSRRAQ